MKVFNPKNVYFINVAKTTGIFLTALAHLSIPDPLYAFINAFHMPLFFFISGYFVLSVDDVSFKTFLLKKTRTLLLPYYIFALITFGFWFFVGKNFGHHAQTDYHTTQYITGALLAIPDKAFMGFNLPIWFLPSLLCAEILFYSIYHYCKKYVLIAGMLLFGLGMLIKAMDFPRLPYGLDVSLYAVIFIYIGHLVRKKDFIHRYFLPLNAWFKIMLLLVAIVITIYISQVNGSVLMYSCEFHNYFLFFIGALTGITGILSISLMIPPLAVFNFYGRNTIIILAFHLMTFSIIKGIQVFLFKIPLETTEAWEINILYVVGGFILLAPVIYFINTYTPFVLGRKKGIR